MTPSVSILVDFDGTIAPVDTTDLLLERFADPSWQQIENEWKSGQIGSRECLVRQIDLVRATEADYDDFVSRIDIDPGFSGFVGLCRSRGHAISVVSDGLDRTVGAVLRRAGFDLPIYANRLSFAGNDRWRLTFPHAQSNCRTLAGNCKCQFADATAGGVRVLVGDGRSDFCVAGQVDLVLAKSALERHCRSKDIPHVGFRNFDEASGILSDWLANNAANSTGRLDQLRDE